MKYIAENNVTLEINFYNNIIVSDIINSTLIRKKHIFFSSKKALKYFKDYVNKEVFGNENKQNY